MCLGLDLFGYLTAAYGARSCSLRLCFLEASRFNLLAYDFDSEMFITDALGLGDCGNISVRCFVAMALEAKANAVIQRRFASKAVWSVVIIVILPYC